MITAKTFPLQTGTKTALAALTYMHSLWLANVCRLEAVLPDGTRIEVPRNKAIVRDDIITPEAILGVVGLVYTPIQNPEAFAFFDIITQQYNGTYETGFIVDDGRQMILVAKIGDNYEVRPGDVIANHITLINSFDGSCPYKAFFTPIRLLSGAHCRASFRGAVNSIEIRHTKTANSRMEDAMRVLNVSAGFFDQFKEVAQNLAQKAITRKLIDTFIHEVFGEAKTKPNKAKLESVVNLILQGKGNTGKTLWDAYNGVCEWTDCFRYAGKTDATAKNAGSAILTGVGLKEKAFKVAMMML